MSEKNFEFDELYPLPSGWQWAPLEDLMVSPKQDIVDGPFGSNLKASEYIDAGVPIARLQNIDRNQFVYKNIKFLSKAKADDLDRHNFKPGDILITKLGDPLGKACIAPDKIPYGIIVADLVRVRVPENGIDRKYLTYEINSSFPVKQFETHTKGTTRPRVNLGIIRQLPIPVAPLAQQTRIVAEIEKQFSRLDEAVANLKRVKANLKRYKAAVLKTAVEGKLTEEWLRQHPDVESADKLLERILAERRKAAGKRKYKEPVGPDTSGLPELPAGWVWASVEQLTRLVTSGSRGWGDSYSEEGPLFIRAQDIKTDNLALRNVARVNVTSSAEGTRSSVSNDDILVTITGANVTKSALVKGLEEQAFVSQHVALLKPCISGISSYLYHWIVSPANGRQQLEKLAYGAGKPGLSLEQVRSLPVALPPLAEQHQIVDEVERRLSIVAGAEAQVDANLRRADRLRQSILKEAFSGQLVPQDGNDEPASMLLDKMRDARAGESSGRKTKGRKGRRSSEMKSEKSKKSLLEIIKNNPGGITPEALLAEANYSLDDIDMFYEQLALIRDLIEQEKPSGKKSYNWPESPLVILKPKGA